MIIIIMVIQLVILNYVNKVLLDYINNNRKTSPLQCNTLIFNVILSSKGSLSFSPPGNIGLHIPCMSILGGCVPDRLPSRRLFELVAATQCTF